MPKALFCARRLLALAMARETDAARKGVVAVTLPRLAYFLRARNFLYAPTKHEEAPLRPEKSCAAINLPSAQGLLVRHVGER